MTQRRADLLVFGGLGVVAFLLLFWIQIYSLELIAGLMGNNRIILDWVRWLKAGISVSPWMVCAVLLVFAIRRRRWTPLLAFGGAQVLGVASMVAAIVGGPAVKDYFSRVPFESAQWKAENRQGARGLRVHMVDDLMRQHPLVGMSRDEVNELLGVPPATAYFREYDYVFWLGRERGAFAIDSEWLVLEFKGNVVVKASVVAD